MLNLRNEKIMAGICEGVIEDARGKKIVEGKCS